MPYERTVASDRPAASRSRKKAVTGSATTPSTPISRNGSYRFPVATSAPDQRHHQRRKVPIPLFIMSGDRTAQSHRKAL